MVNDILPVCVCVCVCERVFSCFLVEENTEKMTGINIEQIKVYKLHVGAKLFRMSRL